MTETGRSRINPEVAAQRIAAFGDRFGQGHLFLAYHAAFPIALTPDLLYRLWANFQYDAQGETLNIPWIAVTDFLLSNLCSEVGHELYEMDISTRNALLNQIRADSRFGLKRINELSNFLLIYVHQQLESCDLDTRDFAQAQRWIALAFTKPASLACEIALTLSELELANRAEWIRLAKLTETFAEQLIGFLPLLAYVRGMMLLAQDNQEKAGAQLEILGTQNKLIIEGIELSIPNSIGAIQQNTTSESGLHETLSFIKITEDLAIEISQSPQYATSDVEESVSPNYWRFFSINSSGDGLIQEIPFARSFLQEQIKLLGQSEVSDTKIQQRLWQTLHSEESTSNEKFLANSCLRCWISNQIVACCSQLAISWGAQHGFSQKDLLPLVLDDAPPRSYGEMASHSTNNYQSFATKILQTFDPSASSLKTWVKQLTLNHRDLNSFLSEQGVYLISDWAILNKTTPERLMHIYQNFLLLTFAESQQACRLLESFHAIYRVEQTQQRLLDSSGGSLPPSLDQLRRISQHLQLTSSVNNSPENIIRQLKEIASRLRQYRFSTESLDDPKMTQVLEIIRFPELDTETEEQSEFLNFYREQVLTCLDIAITQVINDRLVSLPQKFTPNQFLSALRLFFCQGLTMTDIAVQMDLKGQPQVSRLLGLQELRENVKQKITAMLLERIASEVQNYSIHTETQNLQFKIRLALDEQISNLIENTTGSIRKQNSPENLFSSRLCNFLGRFNE